MTEEEHVNVIAVEFSKFPGKLSHRLEHLSWKSNGRTTSLWHPKGNVAGRCEVDLILTSAPQNLKKSVPHLRKTALSHFTL